MAQDRNNPPLVLVLAVGLTPRLLKHAPRLNALARSGWVRPMTEVVPAVTCTAQATILTGKQPSVHGIVANGWYFRETCEVRFWQQSNALIQAEPLYETARRRAAEQGRAFRTAKLFWWFNQGAQVDRSVTPKPYYAADGNKAFGIDGNPREGVLALEKALGPFPFPTFWGPKAGLGSTAWIARCAAEVLKDGEHGAPELTLVYLPHLDYDPQRFGPSCCDMPRIVAELDTACVPLLDAAKAQGARVWVVSEYGHCDVDEPVYLNRVLRQTGLLAARPGPFGEVLDPFTSNAIAVCDHQLAHVYVRDREDIPRVRALIEQAPGVSRVFSLDERAEIGLDHPRSGELIALARPNAWFAYPFWLDDAVAPDYARTVDIHRKPGFDPCELFLDPNLIWPMGRVARRLIQKKLGFRTLFDVVPLDARLVRGSHGLHAADADDRPLLIGDGPAPSESTIPLTAVRDLVLNALG